MRTLKFKVKKQILSKNDRCDFTGLVPGSENWISCKFSFDKNWRNAIKVAEFHQRFDTEVSSVLIDGTTCTVPSEVLKKGSFYIRVVGQDGDTRLTTNKILIRQGGGIT